MSNKIFFKKLHLALLVTLTISSCTNISSNNISLHSVSQLSSSDIKEFDKEFSFSTKALTLTYLKNKFYFLIGNDNGTSNASKIIKNIEYARLKGESVIPAKALFDNYPDLFSTINNIPLVLSERTINQPFDLFLGGSNPFPQTPSNLSNSNISYSTFTANWSPVSGATSYDVIIDNASPINTANTYYTFNDVSSGSHTWKVRANKSNNTSSTYSNTLSVLTSLNTPLNLNTSNINSTGFTASWSSVQDATSYQIVVNNNSPITTSSTSYNVSGLSSGNTHTWKVRALNSSTNSSFSNTESVLTLLSTPTSLSNSNLTNTSFTANWGAVSGATSYDIILDNGTTINTTNTYYNFSGLVSNSTHTWKVRAVNSNTNSSYTSDQSITLTYNISCKALKDSGINTNGVYTIDTDGSGTNAPFQVYCDMTTNGGGWTMVVAQFENDPVTNWNEGIQADYDPSLATKKGFALNTSQIPSHTQTAFGLHKDPTYIDYVNFVYSTGSINTTLVSGLKTSNQYHINRTPSAYFNAHNPEEGGGSSPYWNNTLTFDRTGGRGYTWAFSPNYYDPKSRTYSINGSDIQGTSEPNSAWSVWVR